MDFSCSDRSSTRRAARILISKLSIKNDINFNTILLAAGMAEWVSNSISKRRFLSSKPTDGENVSREKGKSEDEGGEKVSREKR